MGVHGLLRLCLERRQECVEYADLVEVAASRGGIEILVDFYAFEHLVLRHFWNSVSAVTRNPYLRILGGEYKTLEEYLKKLITDLRSLDIELVLYVDGAKGSSRIGTEQKLETWKRRHLQDMEKMRDVLAVLSGEKQIQDLPEESSVRPVLLEVQIFETLKECKCEVVQCSSGEADFVLARNFQSRPKAYAILSNDSDFCIFSCCKFIPHELFDIHGDLALGQEQLLPEKPLRLMVGVIATSRVVSMLELKDHNELIEVSIICGNDFTQHHMNKLKSKVGLGRRVAVSDAVAWVQTYRKAENHPEFAKEMQSNHAFRESVQRSRQFYLLTLPSDHESFKGPMSHFLDEAIRKGQLAANVMSMHFNFYWHRMLLEDCGHGQPSVEVAMAPLRSFIYRMVLDQRDNTVVEYGRTPYEEFASAGVYAVHDRVVFPVNRVNQSKIFQNLRTFHRVMTSQEPHFQQEWYKRYGWRVGFHCYVFRYFLVLNVGRNLRLSLSEFLPLVAMVFSASDDKWYQSLGLLPTTRCVTIGNWFQDVYRHAYYFLGKLLFLSQEFSEPKNVFSGAVSTAFYMVAQHEQEGRCLRRAETVGEVAEQEHEDLHD